MYVSYQFEKISKSILLGKLGVAINKVGMI